MKYLSMRHYIRVYNVSGQFSETKTHHNLEIATNAPYSLNIYYYGGPQGFWGSGENGYLFSGSWGSTGNYFRGSREQAHNFGDLGSLAKKQKNKIRKSLHFV